MILYQGNAPQYLGKIVDANRRILGIYPYKVIQFPDGRYGVEDRVGVCMKLPEKEDDFNVIHFDFVVGEEDGIR